ncbi:MAG: methyltransferase domain-containing protein [Lewinellaceae bacterium]|nr:methyltransferase domain-containing protein [Saprospiraceae bacterium]MCB9331085.1 methyltransferase domain-containing protein [Lewinellaceae bacterium]
MNEYTIHGGLKGINRLEVLSRTVGPSTNAFLNANQDALLGSCLDLGCGLGTVSLNIAQRVQGRGEVLGLDKEALNVAYATDMAAAQQIENVSFVCKDVFEFNEISSCNLVYARFLCSHMNNPEKLLRHVFRNIAPGGRVLIEDTDFSGHFCYPACAGFESYVQLYQRLLHQRGADANIGQRLPQLLKEAGFQDITVQIAQPVHAKGEGKLMAELTMAGISKALIQEQITTQEEIDRILFSLKKFRENVDSLISLPRIIQVSASKPKQ